MKKGFTMIEILAVFTITAAILLIVVPLVIGTLKDGDKKAQESFESNVFIAAEAYAQEELVVTTDVSTVTIKELLDSGYLKSSLVNPENNKKLSDDVNLNKTVKIYKDSEGVLQFEMDGVK